MHHNHNIKQSNTISYVVTHFDNVVDFRYPSFSNANSASRHYGKPVQEMTVVSPNIGQMSAANQTTMNSSAPANINNHETQLLITKYSKKSNKQSFYRYLTRFGGHARETADFAVKQTRSINYYQMDDELIQTSSMRRFENFVFHASTDANPINSINAATTGIHNESSRTDTITLR